MSRLNASTVPAVDPVAALRRLHADGDDAPLRLPPGTRLFVEVIEALTQGGVRARVVGEEGEHRLPFDAQPGARLHVLVAGTAAKPAFVLLGAETAAAAPHLSPTAQLLAALTPATGTALRPPVITARTALAANGEVGVPVLARALAGAIEGSGLFYEAHLVQWLAGRRSRAEVANEPQARLALRDAAGAAANDSPPLAGAPGAAAVLEGVVHRDTVPLVQQQLAAFETGALVWRGDVWRGQTLEWTLERPEPDGRAPHAADPSAPGTWRTRLRLVLPSLGAVEAALAVNARTVDVRLAAVQAGTAEDLEAARAALAAALAAAGLTVTRLEVRHVA